MGWIKTRLVKKLLVRVKFTGNSYSYSTCVNVNGHGHRTLVSVMVFFGHLLKSVLQPRVTLLLDGLHWLQMLWKSRHCVFL